MDQNEHMFQVVCRIEDKLDQHIKETTGKVSRVELLGWLTLLAGIIIAS